MVRHTSFTRVRNSLGFRSNTYNSLTCFKTKSPIKKSSMLPFSEIEVWYDKPLSKSGRVLEDLQSNSSYNKMIGTCIMKKQTWASFPSCGLRTMLKTNLGMQEYLQNSIFCKKNYSSLCLILFNIFSFVPLYKLSKLSHTCPTL